MAKRTRSYCGQKLSPVFHKQRDIDAYSQVRCFGCIGGYFVFCSENNDPGMEIN